MSQNFWYPPGSSQAGIITVNQGTTPWIVSDPAAEASLSSIDTKLTSQATATKQDTGNTSLSSIDTKLSSQATAANQSTGNASLSSIDTKLSSQATAANQTTGNASLSSIDTKLSSQATAAKQDTGNTSLSSIDTKLTSQATAANQSTGNASLSSIDSKLIAETIVASATLSGTALTMDVRGLGAVIAHVGIGLGAGPFNNVYFQGTVDGTNYFAVTGCNLSHLDGQIPTDTTEEGIFSFNVAGLTSFRLTGGGSPNTPVAMRGQPSSSVVNQILSTTYVAGTVSSTPGTPTAGTITQAAVTVGTTAVRCTVAGTAPNAARKLLIVEPDPASTATFFIGSSSVANSGGSRGIQLIPGQQVIFNNDAGDYYIISGSAAQTVFIMEQV